MQFWIVKSPEKVSMSEHKGPWQRPNGNPVRREVLSYGTFWREYIAVTGRLVSSHTELPADCVPLVPLSALEVAEAERAELYARVIDAADVLSPGVGAMVGGRGLAIAARQIIAERDAARAKVRALVCADIHTCGECGGTPESCKAAAVACCPDCTHGKMRRLQAERDEARGQVERATEWLYDAQENGTKYRGLRALHKILGGDA